MQVNQLPLVDRIQGAHLLPGLSHETNGVRIQYSDQKGTWQELSMPLLEAMHLLNALKAIQKDTGYEMPEE